MKIKPILSTHSHRPWALPAGRWNYYQEWNDAVFLHWKVDVSSLQDFMPKDLEIEFFDGSAWVSPACMHYSPGVQVLAWNLRSLK